MNIFRGRRWCHYAPLKCAYESYKSNNDDARNPRYLKSDVKCCQCYFYLRFWEENKNADALTFTISWRWFDESIASLKHASRIPSRDKNKRVERSSSKEIAAIPRISGEVHAIMDWLSEKVITLCKMLKSMFHCILERTVVALPPAPCIIALLLSNVQDLCYIS